MKNLDSELSRIMAQAPSPSGEGWTAVYRPDGNFAGFAGHFPGYPILPAFIQVNMAVHLLGCALKRPHKLERIGTAKFTSQARPNEALRLECLPVTAKGGEAAWDCVISKDAAEAEQVAKFRLHLSIG
jgi:3-hydroxyacyl-[acyl-carrier-protein] dehydratase